MARSSKVRLVATTGLVGALTLASISPALAQVSPTASPTSEPTPTPTTTSTAPAKPSAKPSKPSAKKAVAKKKVLAARTKTIEQLLRGQVTVGPGDQGSAVLVIQRRLRILGLYGPITGVVDRRTAVNIARFNEKFRLREFNQDPTINYPGLVRLEQLTRRPHLPRACGGERIVLCISMSQRIVRLLVNGQPVLGLDARFGRPGDETRRGVFRIFRKVINDVSAQYHSPMPWSMYFSGGQAVHFSRYFQIDGYWGASHGCVNLRDLAGAIQLWRSVPLGTKTVIY